MATLVEPGYFGSEAGTADRTFTWRLRQLLRDMPVSANEQTNGDGTSTFFQISKTAIYDDSYTIVTVNGLDFTLHYTATTVTLTRSSTAAKGRGRP